MNTTSLFKPKFINAVPFKPIAFKIPRLRPTRTYKVICMAISQEKYAKVKFEINHHVEFGQTVCVVGDREELGQWDSDKSLPLEWHEGDMWHNVTALPIGPLEYKYFVKNEDGTVADWPDFVNQVSLRPEIESLNIHDKWVGLLNKAIMEDRIEEDMKERIEEHIKERMEEDMKEGSEEKIEERMKERMEERMEQEISAFD